MKFCAAAFGLLLSAASYAQAGALRRSMQTRNEIQVVYEYQLEVNSPATTGTTSDVMNSIDGAILTKMQKALPNGASVDGMDPNVEFENIDSSIFSACFTGSDQCSLIRSTITVSYAEEKPKHPLELVTYNLVKEYLDTFASDEKNVDITYLYPSPVTTLAQFKMEPVAGEMSDVDIFVLEETFMEVFGAIVAAIEGDTRVVNSLFLYQDLFPATSTNDATDSAASHLMSTDLLINGICRQCTEDEFISIVDDVVSTNLPAYQVQLMSNGETVGTKYFSDVIDLTYMVPVLPSSLDSIDDESVYDNKAPNVDRAIPWFVFLAIGLAVCVLGCGACILRMEKEEFEKPDDTSESEDDYSEGDGSGDNGFVEAEDVTYDQGQEVTAFEEIEDYQVETIVASEDGDGAEVSVSVY
mmetsp:Transcript_8980/g.24284  ORF Transcript_8980/g.24284 Transcript_8980/m.24284 type:complete len:412 (+) Transcript_8980:224-1459(+)